MQAIVAVDLFNHFHFPEGAGLAEQALGMLPRLVDLLHQARERQWPIVYVNDNFDRWHATFDEVIAWTAEKGLPASTRMAAAISPQPEDYVLLKSRHSIFYHTQLASLLTYLEVDQIALAGMAGDACVLTSAMDAHIRGYRVVPVRDAIASATLARQHRAIAQMEDSLGLEVPSLKDYLDRDRR